MLWLAKEKAIFRMVPTILKWLAIPMLLIASIFFAFRRQLRAPGGFFDLSWRNGSCTAGGSIQRILFGCRIRCNCGGFQSTPSLTEDRCIDRSHLCRNLRSLFSRIPNPNTPGDFVNILTITLSLALPVQEELTYLQAINRDLSAGSSKLSSASIAPVAK